MGTGCQDWRSGLRMRLVLLICVLLLPWVSATLAEVLVQPDFDAKKVLGLLWDVPGWGGG